MPFVWLGRKRPDIALVHIPQGPVFPQCVAGGRVDFHKGNVIETGLFKTEGLPSRACAYF
jgi:hypothetical protein